MNDPAVDVHRKNAVVHEASASAANTRYVPAAGRAAFTPIYDLAMRTTMRERAFRTLLLEQALDGLAYGELLDLGCGTGTFTIAAAERTSAVRFTGLDGDAEVLRIARAKDPEEQITWSHASVTSLPFPDSQFDRIVASLLLHHLTDEDKQRALQEARRVLRADGRLHVCDWGPPRGLIPRSGFLILRAIDGRKNTRAHARGEIKHAITAAGFPRVLMTSRLATAWGTLELWRADGRPLQAPPPDSSSSAASVVR